MNQKEDNETRNATSVRPGDFPLGSPQSRAAARLRLQGIDETEKRSISCICFPENEQPFFCSVAEEKIAALVKCPLHGDRFKTPYFHLYVANWYGENEPLRIHRRSPQYQKAWAAAFPPDLWPAEEMEVNGRSMLRLGNGTMLEAQ